MAQWVECLSCRYEGLGSDFQHPRKNPGMPMSVYTLVLGTGRQEDPGGLLASKSIINGELQVQ